MTKKYIDYDEEYREKIDSEVSVGESLTNNSKYENNDIHGICSDCSYFCIVETNFSIIFLACNNFNIPLNLRNKITNCSGYSKRLSMSLWEMKDIATIIEPTERIGF